MQSQTLNKTNKASAIVESFAEAWRNKQVAEKTIKDSNEAMQAILEGGSMEYTFADGATVVFTLTPGERVNPVTFAEAKEITGFGEANMAKISGKVDADAVKAMAKLGKLGADLVARLLPTKPYLQIRGVFKKD